MEYGIIWFFSHIGIDYTSILIMCRLFFVVVIFSYYTQVDNTARNRIKNNMNVASKYDYETCFPRDSKVDAQNEDKRFREAFQYHVPVITLLFVIITNIGVCLM
ncbi:MAG: hypothetical protein JEZ08_03880 [Clostridiales bacterium]|nr:hypothetical protein [Clostridiales bacterium]